MLHPYTRKKRAATDAPSLVMRLGFHEVVVVVHNEAELAADPKRRLGSNAQGLRNELIRPAQGVRSGDCRSPLHRGLDARARRRGGVVLPAHPSSGDRSVALVDAALRVCRSCQHAGASSRGNRFYYPKSSDSADRDTDRTNWCPTLSDRAETTIGRPTVS